MTNEVEKKTEQEKLLEEVENLTRKLLQEQYSKGLAIGGKAFVALIYKTIVDGERIDGKSAENIISEVKDLCKQLFGTNAKFLDMESTETIEDAVEKMREGE